MSPAKIEVIAQERHADPFSVLGYHEKEIRASLLSSKNSVIPGHDLPYSMRLLAMIVRHTPGSRTRLQAAGFEIGFSWPESGSYP